jgi:FHS family L-fucose permease-like MFS transporter
MAIAGGAVLTGLQALVSDRSGDIGLSFLVPAACFALVALYGMAYRGAPSNDFPSLAPGRSTT